MRVRTATLSYRGRDFVFGTNPALGGDRGAWVLEDVTGWFGGVDVRAEATDRLGHGQFQQRAFRGSRGLTLQATYIAREPDERLALERALSGMLYDGDYGTLTCETDLKLSCQVRLDGEVGIVENGIFGVELQMPLIATDPWLYGSSRSTFLTPVGTGIGLRYPLFTGARIPATREYASSFETLSPLTGGGTITAGGGATVSVSTDWHVDGSSSLQVSAGTSKSSSAYLLPRRSLASQVAGRHVTLTGTVHLDSPQLDVSGTVGPTNANPPRALNIGVENDMAGGAPVWAYGNTPSAPNEAGDHDVRMDALMPEDKPGWFIRAFNGSTEVPVWWDNVRLTVRDTVKADVVSSLVLGIGGAKVAQSFAVDPVSGDYYVGQPATGDVDGSIRRVNSTGVETGSMFMGNSGHLNQLAVERDGDDVWVWYWWPAHPNGAVRIRWRDGVVTPEADGVEPLPLYGDGEVLYALGDGYVSTYANRGDYRDTTFTLYDKAAYLAGDAEPVATLEVPRVAQAYQGHAHDGDHLYMHAGGSKSDAVGVWRYAWSGGDPVVVRSNVLDPGRHEAEGIALRGEGEDRTLVLGISTGDVYERVANIVDTTLDQFDAVLPDEQVEAPVLRYGAAVAQNGTIANNGNATAYPTYIVQGSFPGGVSIAAGNRGASIEYPWPITPSAPLRVETDGSAWVGESNVTQRLTRRDFGPFAMPPGSVFKPTFKALQGGEGRVEIRVRDTYI